MDFRQIFRTSKKDEQITELQGKIDEKDKRIAALEHAIGDQAERNASQVKQCLDLSEQLDMAHKVQVNQAEVITVQKRDIADLQGECLRLASENASWDAANNKMQERLNEFLAFLHSLHKGDFRSNRTERFDAAQSLLWKYDSADDNQMISK